MCLRYARRVTRLTGPVGLLWLSALQAPPPAPECAAPTVTPPPSCIPITSEQALESPGSHSSSPSRVDGESPQGGKPAAPRCDLATNDCEAPTTAPATACGAAADAGAAPAHPPRAKKRRKAVLSSAVVAVLKQWLQDRGDCTVAINAEVRGWRASSTHCRRPPGCTTGSSRVVHHAQVCRAHDMCCWNVGGRSVRHWRRGVATVRPRSRCSRGLRIICADWRRPAAVAPAHRRRRAAQSGTAAATFLSPCPRQRYSWAWRSHPPPRYVVVEGARGVALSLRPKVCR